MIPPLLGRFKARAVPAEGLADVADDGFRVFVVDEVAALGVGVDVDGVEQAAGVSVLEGGDAL